MTFPSLQWSVVLRSIRLANLLGKSDGSQQVLKRLHLRVGRVTMRVMNLHNPILMPSHYSIGVVHLR